MNEIAVEGSTKSERLKARFVHEMRELMIVVAYLALFLFAFATYKMLVLHQFNSALVVYGSALLKAWVLAKVIIVGQALKLGRRWEEKPLLSSAIVKAAMFAVLTGLFQVLEEVVTGMFHGEGLTGAIVGIGERGTFEIAVMVVVAFCVYIPFFALMETRRVLGREEFSHLFLRRSA